MNLGRRRLGRRLCVVADPARRTMAYLPWQKFMAGRAASSIFCFRVRWSDGTRPPGKGGRTFARPGAPDPLSVPRLAVKRGPNTLTLRSVPPALAASPPPPGEAEQPIPLPGRLKKWLTANCRGTWSMNRMHGGRVCILGFESSSDYARLVSFLAPNGPWRPSGMPACAAARTTDVDAARLKRLFTPEPAPRR
jgi:hypothetical protein